MLLEEWEEIEKLFEKRFAIREHFALIIRTSRFCYQENLRRENSRCGRVGDSFVLKRSSRPRNISVDYSLRRFGVVYALCSVEIMYVHSQCRMPASWGVYRWCWLFSHNVPEVGSRIQASWVHVEVGVPWSCPCTSRTIKSAEKHQHPTRIPERNCREERFKNRKQDQPFKYGGKGDRAHKWDDGIVRSVKQALTSMTSNSVMFASSLFSVPHHHVHLERS